MKHAGISERNIEVVFDNH